MSTSPNFKFRPAREAPSKRVFLGTLGLAPTPHTVERKPHPDGHAGILHSLGKVQEYANKGMTHPVVRAWAIARLKAAGNPKDNVGRASALLAAVRKEKIWVPDPVRTEMMQGAHLTLGGMFEGGDCFAEGTLLLTDRHELVPIEQIQVGQRIWGLDRWVRVEAAVSKGVLPIDVVTLNNGSQLRLTADHHVNVLICPRHPYPKEGQAHCSCPAHARVAERMRVGDLKPGMVLPSPERLPFGEHQDLSPERAYIEGLYLADGWCEDSRFAISGKDGCPKEEQKREVQSLCERMGIATSWQDRYLRVNDRTWTDRLRLMGSHAPDKHLLSLHLNAAQTSETLRGIMADSGLNACGSRTLTTTSRLLAVQARVLHKMLGISCGWAFLENHGGLGKNPIWRLSTRRNTRSDGRAPWLLRVREVAHKVVDVPCYDIQTEDHNVYLPEHDVTVLNCDDLTIAYLSAYLAACTTVGAQAAVVGHSYGADREITHVLGAILDGSTWHYVEPSTDKIPFGESYSPTREIVLWVPGDGQVACDADRCLTGPSRKLPNDNSANFVGINGLGAGVGADGETALEESGDTSFMGTPSALDKETSSGVGAWVLGMLQHVVASRDEPLRSFDSLNEIAEVDGQGLNGTGWNDADTQKTRRLIIAGDQFAKVLSEIINGTRAFKFSTQFKAYGWDKQQGDLDIQVTDDDVVIKGSPSLFVNGGPGLGNPAAAAAPAAAVPGAAAAAAPAVAVSVPVIIVTLLLAGGTFVAGVYAWSRLTQYQSLRAQEEARRRITELYSRCLQSQDCTPEQRELIGRAFGKAAQGLQPAGAAPVQTGVGEGSGYGWSWLAWPMLIGIGAVAFLTTSREYVRLANRRRRIKRRDAREVDEKRQASRQRYAPIRRVAGVDPQTKQTIAVIDDDEESGFLSVLRSF